ncbi:MAG: aminoacetone oxidase family FAD-binding enzyme [Acidobacteriaceae bacterium]
MPFAEQDRVRQTFDVVVVGAGAAGLMCAIEAGRRGRRVLLLEHAERVGKKILISGGGRCNFTNLHCRPENFLSANPHFAKSALARYTPADFVRLVQSYGIAYHEKTLGQLFCDGPAEQIVGMLLSESAKANVRIMLQAKVQDVIRESPSDDRARNNSTFLVITDTAAFSASALVVATGGLSIPRMGSTSFGYDIARQFGVPLFPCRAALVPLVLGGAEHTHFCGLTGVSAAVKISIRKQSFQEKLLFTHRGLSGPAVLQISSYWNGAEPVLVDWAPGHELFASLREPGFRRDLSAAKAALQAKLPTRLAERLLDAVGPLPWTNHGISELERRLHAWPFTPVGTEGFDKAEVTAGGVSTEGLSAQTMECRDVPGLYFIGEVLDVTGHLGGFNFQWAWASGAAAGRAA